MIGNRKTLEAMRGFSMCTFCREKTKFAVKDKGDNRYVLDCKNKNCMVYKSRRIWDSKSDLKKLLDSEDFKDKLKIADKNFQNGTYAGYISAMRKASKTSTREMAQIAGCTPEEYCAYEQERKIFDPEVYEKCEKYLKDVKGRSIADLYAELCMPETNCVE